MRATWSGLMSTGVVMENAGNEPAIGVPKERDMVAGTPQAQ